MLSIILRQLYTWIHLHLFPLSIYDFQMYMNVRDIAEYKSFIESLKAVIFLVHVLVI